MIKTYFADTNFYLRFLLQDIKDQATETENLLKKARDKKILIIFLPEVILEMTFVLESFYKVSKDQISRHIKTLVKTDYLDIKNRNIWMESFEIYEKNNISIFDIYLFLQAQKNGSEVLSYDTDFKKLQKLFGK